MAEDYDPFSAAEDAYDPFAAADAPAPAADEKDARRSADGTPRATTTTSTGSASGGSRMP